MNKYLSLLICFFTVTAFAQSEDITSPADTRSDDAQGVSIGAGVGIPYGVAGLNLNFRPSEQVELLLGAGALGPAFGLRLYPFEEAPALRFTVVHGANTEVSCVSFGRNDCEPLKDKYSGINLGLGFGPEIAESGWEFDVIYIATRGSYDSDLKEAEENGVELEGADEGRLKISGGYRWAF